MRLLMFVFGALLLIGCSFKLGPGYECRPDADPRANIKRNAEGNLTICLQNGKLLVFEDNHEDGEAYSLHRVSYVPESNSYRHEAEGWEWISVELIDAETGEITLIESYDEDDNFEELPLEEYLLLCRPPSIELGANKQLSDAFKAHLAKLDRVLIPPTEIARWHYQFIESFRKIVEALDKLPPNEQASTNFLSAHADTLAKEMEKVQAALSPDIRSKLKKADCYVY